MKEINPVLKTSGLSKSFRRGFWGTRVKVLDAVDLAVSQGEVFGLLGPNGAGKSTTFRILAGLMHPTSGHAWLCGRHVGDPEISRHVGYLPDMPSFYDYLTAEESLRFSGRLGGLGQGRLRARIDELLHLIGLAEVRHRRLRTFSKGMLQRMGIAQALIHDPQLLMLDEPMSGLDPVGRRDMRDLILRLKQQGKTILLSSHLLNDVELLCDRVGVLVNGRMAATGHLHELAKVSLSQPVDIVVEGLGASGIASLRPLTTSLVVQGEWVLATVALATSVECVLDMIRTLKARVISLQPRGSVLQPLWAQAVGDESRSRA